MAMLKLGEPAPWFVAPAIGGSQSYSFPTVGGRYVVMLFYGSAARPECAAALALLDHYRALFDDVNASFYGISVDPGDQAESRIAQSLPGIRHFLDFDRAVSKAFGAIFASDAGDVQRPVWILLDRTLRLMELRALDQGEAIMRRLTELAAHPEPHMAAPVLTVPRIFEPELCRELVGFYDRGAPTESGYMIERNGKTVGVVDYSHKRRSDCLIDDIHLRETIRVRLTRALLPMIQRAYQFEVTRIERWIVACYDAGVGGYFRPHRDNTTSGTAHRRFACTINLNAEDFEGGELRFPEYGQSTYRAPTGGAVIFSCSLLHEATPVTSGRRYAFLPFFYDEAAAAIRLANNAKLDPDIGDYRGVGLGAQAHAPA